MASRRGLPLGGLPLSVWRWRNAEPRADRIENRPRRHQRCAGFHFPAPRQNVRSEPGNRSHDVIIAERRVTVDVEVAFGRKTLGQDNVVLSQFDMPVRDLVDRKAFDGRAVFEKSDRDQHIFDIIGISTSSI